MKKWSFLFWTTLCVLFVGGAYKLNTSSIEAYDREQEVLAASTATAEVTSPVEMQRDATLDALALERAKDMATQQYYAHESPQGTYFYDLFASYGIDTETPSCENLLLMESGLTREQVDAQWENSPSHKACLEAPHTTYGYAEVDFVPELDLSVYVYIAASQR